VLHNPIDQMEYTFVIIKPDGVEKQIESKLLSILSEFGMKPVLCNQIKLSKSDVKNTFIHSHEAFLNYMSRSHLTAILVSGENAFQRLRLLKPQIRKFFGDMDDMENFIHTPEAGNEYDLQFRTFFTELSSVKHSLYADMYVKAHLPDDIDLLGRIRILLRHRFHQFHNQWYPLT